MGSFISSSTLLIGKVVLPPLLCVILLLVLETASSHSSITKFGFLLVFAFAIVAFNYGKTKHNFVLSLLLSLLLSCLVFFVSVGVFFGLGSIMQFIGIETSVQNFIGKQALNLFALVPMAIIAPFLMFLSYQLLFQIEKSRVNVFVKWSAIFALILGGVMNVFSFMSESVFIYWQVVMALALQLMLYQNELKALFRPKLDHPS